MITWNDSLQKNTTDFFFRDLRIKKPSEKKCNNTESQIFPSCHFLSVLTLSLSLCAEKSGLPLVTWKERRPWWSLSSCLTSAVTSLLRMSSHIKLKEKSRRGKGKKLPLSPLPIQTIALFGAREMTNLWIILSVVCVRQQSYFCSALGKKKRNVSDWRRRRGSVKGRRRRDGGLRKRRGWGERRRRGDRQRTRGFV